MTRPNLPPQPYREQLALKLAWGQHEAAKATLAALNRIQRAFDKPDYVMPEPAVARGGYVVCVGLTEVEQIAPGGIAA